MGLPEKIRARVSPHLPVGEAYVIALPAVGGIAARLAHRYRVIVVTDVRIHLFSAALWQVCKPKRLLASLPPGTVLEPRADFHYQVVHLAGEKLWIMPAWDDELRQAVAASRSHVAT